MLLVSIPHFKDLLIASFECPECGFRCAAALLPCIAFTCATSEAAAGWASTGMHVLDDDRLASCRANQWRQH